MPRTAKKMQPVAAPQDQGYGQRGEQIAAMNQMGIPDNTAPQEPMAPEAGGAAPPMDPAALLQMMQEQSPPPPGGLARPTDRPDEPLMAGAGVPVTPERNVAAETLEAMAAATGDPRFAAMAQRARMI